MIGVITSFCHIKKTLHEQGVQSFLESLENFKGNTKVRDEAFYKFIIGRINMDISWSTKRGFWSRLILKRSKNIQRE